MKWTTAAAQNVCQHSCWVKSRDPYFTCRQAVLMFYSEISSGLLRHFYVPGNLKCLRNFNFFQRLDFLLKMYLKLFCSHFSAVKKKNSLHCFFFKNSFPLLTFTKNGGWLQIFAVSLSLWLICIRAELLRPFMRFLLSNLLPYLLRPCQGQKTLICKLVH